MDQDLNPSWPPERIYKKFNPNTKSGPGLRIEFTPMPPQLSHKLLAWLRAGMDPRINPFADEFVQMILDENLIPREEAISLDQFRTVPMTKETPCPICHGEGTYLRRFIGETSKLEVDFLWQCICEYHRARWAVLGDPKIVPPRFRGAILSALAPSPLSKMATEAQVEIIRLLQQYPKDSYFIHGPAGTGKTYLSLALFENAISDWASICFRSGYTDRTFFRVSTKTWVDEIFAWRYRDRSHDYDDDAITIPKPTLNVESIQRLAKTPGVHISVIFDEIDKFGVTDKRLVELFEITNMLSEVGAQMIATSNHSPDELTKRWNSGHSDAILRRFYDSTGGEPRHLLTCALPDVDGQDDEEEDQY